jgi:phosphohistidine phosphatase
MDLYVLRHGIAEERKAGVPDRGRMLTPRGVRRMRKIASALSSMEVRVERILTSPYERAQGTAAIVRKALGAPVTVLTHLRPNGDPRRVIERLHTLRGEAENLMIIGHEPMLSRIVSVLLTGSATAAAVPLKKGGLCKLTVGDPRYGQCASLEWLLTPRLLIGRLR